MEIKVSEEMLKDEIIMGRFRGTYNKIKTGATKIKIP